MRTFAAVPKNSSHATSPAPNHCPVADTNALRDAMKVPARHAESVGFIAASVERPRRKGNARIGKSSVRGHALVCLDVASTHVIEVATLALAGIVHFREEGHAHVERRNTGGYPVTQMCLHVDPHARKF
ncbi:hypothetical protein Cni_G02434 [Canna indica]|uniref:Uncharacterized protein n=1 Tax=Canna indica TaxID=4628 RepID=A0AAQ3JR95_9LILI|nr:hypothetical protein Cni_G02434 [Canna indica]